MKLSKPISLNNKINQFNKDGFFIKKNFLSKKRCNDIIKKLEIIKKKRQKKKLFTGDKTIEVIFNFFYEDLSLLKLIINKTVNSFIKKILDKHYVLQVNSARNVLYSQSKKKKAAGYKWHKDNRFINRESMKPCVLHSVIICLDDFNNYNGATEYIPNSHKSNLFFNRNQNKNKSKKILANKGDLIFLHGNLIHKAGKNSKPNTSRWSIFAFYTPWWVKPSINFKKYMSKQSKKMSKQEKKVLHFETTPPEKYINPSYSVYKKK